MKKIQAINAYYTLDRAKLGGLGRKENLAVIGLMVSLKAAADEWDSALKKAQEKLKPEGWDAISEKSNKGKELTAEEAEISKNYNRDLNELMAKEGEKECDAVIEPISRETVAEIAERNADWTVSTMMMLVSAVCAEPKKDEPKEAKEGE